jgi:hypothetical protein
LLALFASVGYWRRSSVRRWLSFAVASLARRRSGRSPVHVLEGGEAAHEQPLVALAFALLHDFHGNHGHPRTHDGGHVHRVVGGAGRVNSGVGCRAELLRRQPEGTGALSGQVLEDVVVKGREDGTEGTPRVQVRSDPVLPGRLELVLVLGHGQGGLGEHGKVS